MEIVCTTPLIADVDFRDSTNSSPTVAPGGVSPNLALWLKADAGVTESGGIVSQWDDQEGTPNNATATGVGQPILLADGMNFNPTLHFDGTDNAMDIADFTGIPIENTPRSAFVVASVETITGTKAVFGMYEIFVSGTTEGEVLAIFDDDALYGAGLNIIISPNPVYATDVPVVTAGNHDVTANTVRLYANGNNLASQTAGGPVTITALEYVYIGGDTKNSSNYLDGKISEVILYGGNLTTTERQQIDSYLAIKYGITLDQTSATNYLLSDGSTVVWDATANATYSNDIAGIARDNTISCLHQKQSKSVNADAIVTMGHTDILATNQLNTNDLTDSTAMVWGNNNGAATWTATGAPTGYEILSRQWRIQETGTVDSVKLQFDVADANFDVPALQQGTTYYLIYDSNNDNDLSDETPIALTNSSGDIWETTTNIDFADGMEFSLATEVIPTGSVRLLCVDPNTETVKLKNFSTATIDISNYRLCSKITYTTNLSGETLLSGSLNLAAGAEVEIQLTSISLDDTAADLGLYLDGTTDFSLPAGMVDFTQWGSAGNGRESVAATKGIWTAGTYISPNENPEYCYIDTSGVGNGAIFWKGNLVEAPVEPSEMVVICADTTWTVESPITATDCGGGTSGTASPAGGSYTIDGTGCVDYTAPASPAATVDSVCVVICDANNVCDTTYVVIPIDTTAAVIIAPPVDPTEMVTVCGDTTWVTASPITASDCAGNTSGTANPQGGAYAIDAAGCITYTAPANPTGTIDSVCLVICDANGICDTTTVIFPIDTTAAVIIAPPVDPTEMVTVCGDTTWVTASPITASDCAGNTSGTASPQGGAYTIDAAGCITYTAPANPTGTIDSVCLVICDANGICDTTTVIFPIDTTAAVIIAPPVDPTEMITVCGDTTWVTASPITASDCAGNTSGTASPQGGAYTIDAAGCITYTAPANPTGTIDSVCLVICDANGICDTTTVIFPIDTTAAVIIVSPVDPTEMVTVCGDTTWVTASPITASDCAGNTSGTASPQGGAYTIDAAGCITYTAPANPTGTIDSVCLVICDANGICDTTTVIFPIDTTAAVIIAPPVDPTEMITVCGDTTWVTASPITASDCAGNTSGTASPQGGAYTIDAAGCITYTAPANPTGTIDSVCLVICDANGICDTTTVIFPIDTTAAVIIAPPVDPTEMITVCGDTTWVTASPITASDCAGNTSGTASPQGGAYTIDAAGCITYTAPANPTGIVDSVCLVICDANGICDTTTVIFPIDTTAAVIIAPPVDPTEMITVCGDTTWATASPITASDCAGNTSGTASPAGGSYTIDGTGCVDYTAPANPTATVDTVCVVICDANNVCDTTYVVIPIDTSSSVVSPPNPVDPGEMITVCLDTSWVLASPITATDCGGSTSGTASPAGGSYTIDGTGCVDYTAPANPTATVDSICVVICDSNNVCDTTYVVIPIDTSSSVVSPPNPVDPGEMITVCLDTSWVLASPITATDCGGSTSGTASPAGGSYTIDGTGCVDYTAPANPTSTVDTVCVVICDSNNVCDTTYVVISIDTSSIDTDGDGIPDDTDTDDDNDGILDTAETGDTDGDGIPDSLESNVIDTDGDGMADYNDNNADNEGAVDGTGGEENGVLTGPWNDGDNDGIPDHLDADDGNGTDGTVAGAGDSDNDGLSDAEECPSGFICPDSDGDGIPDYMDTDSDNDGTSDLAECPSGTPCTDTDNDGIPDNLESNTIDTDGDGNPDFNDNNADDDGDGTDGTGGEENGVLTGPWNDTDNDGIPDHLDADEGTGADDSVAGAGDSDGDGVSDADECPGGYICPDSDGDGVPDYMDTDSDNDGIPDATECGGNSPCTDTDNDGIPDNVEHNTRDTDDDGNPDYNDPDADGDGPSPVDSMDTGDGLADADGDGIPNYLDASNGDGSGDDVLGSGDSDGDGVSDGEECPEGIECPDSDGDGVPDYMDTDSDNDGIPDATECGGNSPCTDTDNDGIPDNVEHNTRDTDDDGNPDYNDPDADGDGPSPVDSMDTGDGLADADGDGIPNYLDASNGDGSGDDVVGSGDSDGDGVSDGEECPEGIECPDSDGDGVPDYMDTDSDNDGIPDATECGGNSPCTDTDNDGIPDNVESNTQDTDGDGNPDYNDPDADGDGPGPVDSMDTGDGLADADGDGIPNYLDPATGSGGGTDITACGDSDSDGLSDCEECPNGVVCPDSDGDNIPDYMDDTDDSIDSDGDGDPDSTDPDDDNDGILDTAETGDTDGDGIPDSLESNIIDTDDDGNPDFNDNNADDDGDGTDGTGGEENGVLTGPWNDTDNDGIPDHLDADEGTGADDSVAGAGDSDGDGVSDADECPGGYICPDSDGDGVPDYMDTDSDNDGIPDATECGGNSPCTDTDNDGIPDNVEHNTRDTDDDGNPDYNDPDADGDGPSPVDSMDTGDGLADADGDGIPNYLDASNGAGGGTDIAACGDSDGDGLSDCQECPNGIECPDTDGNMVPDYMEISTPDSVDLFANFTFANNSLEKDSSTYVIVNVNEIMGNSTSGNVEIFIPFSTGFTYTFDDTITDVDILGNETVNNGDWTLTSNPSGLRLSTSSVISGNGRSRIAILVKADQTATQANLTVNITPASGGEIQPYNNVSALSISVQN